jgi:DNA-binding phage protein
VGGAGRSASGASGPFAAAVGPFEFQGDSFGDGRFSAARVLDDVGMGVMAALTKDVSEIVSARIKREPELALALLDDSLSLFLNGEPDVARLVLRDVVNGTIGLSELATMTACTVEQLDQMLSANGDPTMGELTKILGVLRRELRVEIQVQSVACA